MTFYLSYSTSCTDESGTEILPRSGTMEAIQTSELVAVGRGDKIFMCLYDGFRVDGTRHNHGFHHCLPRDQSIKTGRHFSKNLNTNLTPPLQLADIARGLKYLHDWPSVHADLKSVRWVFFE